MDVQEAKNKILELLTYMTPINVSKSNWTDFDKVFYGTHNINYQALNATDQQIINGGNLVNDIILPTVKHFVNDEKTLQKKDLLISSFFRSNELNEFVSGSNSSFHLSGGAMDIVVLEQDVENRPMMNEVFEYIKANHHYTELITEYYERKDGSLSYWIHVALMPGRESERQTITKLNKQSGASSSSAGNTKNSTTIDITAAVTAYSTDKNLSKDFLKHVMVQYDPNDKNLDLPGILKRDVFRKTDRQSEWSALNPITIELTMDGISGINIGNAFMLDVLPTIYEKNGVLQITEISDSISSSGWKTKMSAIYRIKGKSSTGESLDKVEESNNTKKENKKLDK